MKAFLIPKPKKLYQRPQHTYTQTGPRLDNAIRWMNPYPVESALCSVLHSLSVGERRPPFKQLDQTL